MPERNAPACLIAAGGTAGHVLPALAVGQALRDRGARVTFAGSPRRAEARLVPEAGFELDTFRVSGLPRRPGLAQAHALLHALAAPAACDRILARRKPNVVLGAGSFVGGPMVLAAARRRIPAAVTEADAHLGLANRLAAPFAKRVFLSFPIDGYEPPKYEVVGRPLPANARPLARDEARVRLGLPAEGPVLLVPVLDGLGAAYGAADLALMRSGSTVWELAAAGLPAVLVPYPFASADHQTKNARYFQTAGGAILLPETELGHAPDVVRSLLDDQRRLEQMRAAMLRVAKPDAAEKIAEELIALARG